MSQYPIGTSIGGMPGEYGMDTLEPPRTSGMAVTSLVLSLLGIIPCLGLITAPIGALLGLIGVVTIKPPKKGKGMAVAGLLLGLVIGGVHGYIAYWIGDLMYKSFLAVEKGPRDALTKAFAGDISGFKAEFYGAGAAASDAEAQQFIDALRSRYGAFQSSKIDESSGRSQQPQFGQAQIDMPYVLTFDSGTVNAEAQIIFADQTKGAILNKLSWIKIVDPVNGDLQYPSPAGGTSGTGSSDTPNGDGDGDADPDADNND